MKTENIKKSQPLLLLIASFVQVLLLFTSYDFYTFLPEISINGKTLASLFFDFRYSVNGFSANNWEIPF